MSYEIGQIAKGRVQTISVNEEGLAESIVISSSNNGNIIIPINEINLIETEKDLVPRVLARRFIGKLMIAKIINTNPMTGSNKQALAEKKQTINLVPGQEIEGVVVAVESDEAKIEYKDCIITTLSSTEYNSLKTVNLRFVLKVGNLIKVQILSVDDENEEVTVTHKPYSGNTWEKLLEKYHIGSQHLGKIANTVKYGAFVNLEHGIDILCTPYPFFDIKRGDEVAVEITGIDEKAGRIRGIITAKAFSA